MRKYSKKTKTLEMEGHQKIHLMNEITSWAPSENSRFPLWLLLFGLDDLLILLNIFAQSSMSTGFCLCLRSWHHRRVIPLLFSTQARHVLYFRHCLWQTDNRCSLWLKQAVPSLAWSANVLPPMNPTYRVPVNAANANPALTTAVCKWYITAGWQLAHS